MKSFGFFSDQVQNKQEGISRGSQLGSGLRVK